MSINELIKRKIKLEKIIFNLKTNLKILPEGRLLIKHNKTKYIQYFYSKPTSGKLQYLSIKNDKTLITQLAKKSFILKTLKAAETELKLLNNLINHVKVNSLSQFYDNFNPSIKPFINPVEISVQEKIRLFEQRIPEEQFSRTGQYVIKTTRGEYVKSQAEYLIAETLLKYKVPYIYEDRFPTLDHKLIKPDFTAINLKTGKILIWEHLGMLERPGYLEDNTSKLHSYSLSGIYPGNGIIITISTKTQPLEESLVETIVKQSFLK